TFCTNVPLMLPLPAYLWLEQNQISDLFPLVQNAGIASADGANLMSNPLSPSSRMVYIPELGSGGVNQMHDCP
ncbi:MAG: hypothetical protein PVI06_12630, partial [Desulfobacterales bacterium]